ncbi:MAG: hypothetical protein IJS84_00080 [Spirochaetales bacterium]|nr:hypothetical protein [Spirochaetales bacterium]MBQ7643407.1 hypothetical protein [Spirochaetales bacterium]
MGIKSWFKRLKSWFSGLNDKKQHFIVCLIASFFVGLINLFAGFMTAMGLGFGKEFGDDRAPGNRWDWKDIGADLIGAVLGTAFALLFRFLLGLLF